MTADLKAMLDELMGRDRNLSLKEKEKSAEHWSDESVCKYFLVKFCPHDLFTNTKADLGPCKFTTHDVKIRETYRTSQRFKTMGYEMGFLRTLEGVVDDMERKIKRQHERLEHDERYMKAEQQKADDFRNTRLETLNKEIDELLEKMAEAGSEGNVDEAQSMMRQVEAMRQEREAIKASKNEDPGKKVFLVKQNVPFINEMKHMEVCPVCGAFLVVNDTQTRVDAHLSGKQHMGYAMIREAIKDLRAERDAELTAAEEKRKAQIAAREKEEEEKKKELCRSESKDASDSRGPRGFSRERERSRRDADRYSARFGRSSRDSNDRKDDRKDDRRDDRRDRDNDRNRGDRKSRDRRSRDRRSSRDRSRRTSQENDRKKEDSEKTADVKKEETAPAKEEPKEVDASAKEEPMEETSNQYPLDGKADVKEEKEEQVKEEPGKDEPGKDEPGKDSDVKVEPSSSNELAKEGDTEKTDEKPGEKTGEKRDERRRSRDRRSSSRERSRKRDRSRDRSRRDRSRERPRRDRSRDKRRSRSRDRRRSYERKRSRH